jgi:hypothetical protein
LELPLKHGKIDTACFSDFDAFLSQQKSLQSLDFTVSTVAYPALRIHHAVPRNVGIVRELSQNRAHLPRVGWLPGECCDLAVGGDTTGRDLPHDSNHLPRCHPCIHRTRNPVREAATPINTQVASGRS